jgi:hypothetical protein
MEPTRNRAPATRRSAQRGRRSTASQLAKGLASQAIGRARGIAQDRVGVRKERYGSQLGAVAKALQRTSEDLGDALSAPVVRRAAGFLEEVAEIVRSADIRGALRSTERFARREPMLFLGGALALGLLAGRFLKSSAQAHDGEDEDDAPDYDVEIEEAEDAEVVAAPAPRRRRRGVASAELAAGAVDDADDQDDDDDLDDADDLDDDDDEDDDGMPASAGVGNA